MTPRGFVLFLLGAALAAPALAQGPERNRSIPDVESQFLRLKHHAEVLGFRVGNHPFDLSGSSHWQGIQRWNGPGAPHLFLSHSANASDVKEATLVVVRMASRDGDGERLRSNRLVHGSRTQSSAPPPQDTVVARVPFPDYQHGGGMQLVGDVLAVPLEERNSEDVPEGAIFFFDVSNPGAPVRFAQMAFPEKVGVVALTDLPDGRYLLATSHGTGQEVQFFRSNGPDFRAPGFAFEPFYTWHALELRPLGQAFWPWSTDSSALKMVSSHQTLNFVKQDDGALYLLGSHNTHNHAPAVSGDDVAVLYRVEGFLGNGPLVLTEVVGRHFINESPGADNAVNFNAGGGVYVSPTGELILYAVEHYVKGPQQSVELTEIRDVDVYRPDNPRYKPLPVIEAPVLFEGDEVVLDGSGSLPMGVRAWVELYADADGWRPRLARLVDPLGGALAWSFDSPKPDRSLVVDLADHARDDFHDFGQLDQATGALPAGFHDTASSLRWYAPPGCGVFVAEHDAFAGKRLELNDGLFPFAHLRAAALPNLADHLMCGPGGCADADDKASSVFFHDNCFLPPPPLGKFVWAGGSGDGDFTGNQEAPSVSFAALDGPAEVEVQLSVCHAEDWCGKTTRVLRIQNVAPSVEAGADRAVQSGAPVAFLGSFKDPGRDTHKIEWDFGDGATADGTLTPSHSYAQPGSYVVRLTVTDHDQAASTDTLKVVVADSDPPPTADAGPDVQAIEGTPVSFLGGFEDAGPGTSHKLVWTFGDGSGAEGRLDPSHAYADDGRYLVTLTVTDEGGHKGSDTLWVTVANAAPSAKLTLLGSPVLECAGAGTPQWRQITISHTDAGTADTHTAEVAWGNGLAQALGAPPWMVAVPHYPRTGAFTVAGHVADDDGGTGSDSLTLQVVDTVPPAFAGLLPATSIPASDPKGTPFDVPLPQVTDACGSALVTSDSPGVFPVGITKVTFTASDDAGNTATASTTVTVTNRPPVPAPATLSTVEDVPLGIRLEASDPDGHALQFKLTSQPAHGKLSGNPPLLAYAPDKDWNGTDEFSFSVSDGFGPAVTASVSIKVQAVNDPPSAASSTYTISEDTPLAVKLGGSDVDSDKLALQPASAPAHGTLVTLDGDTSRILYTPAPNWSGTDSFQFIVFDGERSATGTIQIIVAPVDDAPVALAQQLGTREGVPVQILLAGADVEGGALTFLVTQGPVHGALSGAAPRLTYTPAPGFSGTDTFFFATSDGSSSSAPAAVVVTVTADPDGRMHGDGHVEQDDARHSFDFRAFEHAARERGRLSYTRRDDDRKRGKGKKQPRELDRFQATRIDVLAFSDDSLTKPGDRKPPAVDTVLMAGVGTWNGEAGYAFEMTATDAGEPGRGRDRFLLVVTDPEGFVVARVDGTLDGGNVQSKRLAKGWR